MANNIESNYFFLNMLQTILFISIYWEANYFFSKKKISLPPKIFKSLLPNMDGWNVIQNPQIFQWNGK